MSKRIQEMSIDEVREQKRQLLKRQAAEQSKAKRKGAKVKAEKSQGESLGIIETFYFPLWTIGKGTSGSLITGDGRFIVACGSLGEIYFISGTLNQAPECLLGVLLAGLVKLCSAYSASKSELGVKLALDEFLSSSDAGFVDLP